MPLAIATIAASASPDDLAVFVVEGRIGQRLINGHRVMSADEFYSETGERRFNVAIGDSRVRERIANECAAHDIRPFSIVAASSTILEANEIGEGAILSPQSVVTSNVRIGRFFHANIQSCVTHDCVIGDFVTFGPGVRCNGNVHIGNHAYIGAGALLRQGRAGKPLIIGEGATVGMGAVVLKDVDPFMTVVGNPARPMEKK
jgi:sugar O-acyltransferase (sialic acid O-acetyltransferase NeuD family)